MDGTFLQKRPLFPELQNCDRFIWGKRAPSGSSMLESNPAMQQDFSYRNPEDDQLFQADYDHMGSDEDCKNCDEERLMFQLSTILWPYWLRTSNDTGVTRERLRQEREAAELPMHRNTRDLRLLWHSHSHCNRRLFPILRPNSADCNLEIRQSSGRFNIVTLLVEGSEWWDPSKVAIVPYVYRHFSLPAAARRSLRMHTGSM